LECDFQNIHAAKIPQLILLLTLIFRIPAISKFGGS
jgi:hypothetical protein